MRAVQLASFGVENIELRDVADSGGSRRGSADRDRGRSTINPADYGMVTGGMASFLPPSITPPYIPGWDLAGMVVDVGDDADRSLVGSRVVGFSTWVEAGHGTQAARVALPLANVAVAPRLRPRPG